MLSNEDIGFLVRETGWTLEYIRSIPIAELLSLIDELSYQKQLDDYRMQVCVATVVATMANLWGGERVKPTDLVGHPPLRHGQIRQESDIWSLAQQAGIRIPKDRD